MNTHSKIATALMLAALFTTSIANAEPKGLVGNFGHRAAASAQTRTADCNCSMMKADAAQCMAMMSGHPDGSSKPASAG